MNNLVEIIKLKLDKSGSEYKFIELPADISTDISEHVKFHGIELKEAVPTLVCRTEKGMVAVQRRADTKMDNRKLREVVGGKRLSLVGESELRGLGVEPGAVPLTGLDMPYFVDKKVLELEFAYGGGGRNTLALKIRPADLVKVNGARIAGFTAGGETKKRILSGMRASGRLHLGNYLGGAKGMLALQKDLQYETFYMVADLHGLTTPYDKEELAEATRNVIIDYLAAGLDPEKSAIFVQSQVPEHAELAYLLSTVTTLAKMTHLPTYKEKVKQYPEHATLALVSYPVLMAADILVYKAGLVPVGIDQEPHLEVAREIARRMNAEYGTDFPEPVRFATKGEYVPSLTGEGKMSKSVEGSYIALTDNLSTIRAKLAKAPTDAGGPGEVPKAGPVANLFTFLELFAPNRLEYYAEGYRQGKIRYSEMKEELSMAIFREIEPLQKRRAELTDEYVDEVIRVGAKKAREVAGQTVAEVKEKMGLLI